MPPQTTRTGIDTGHLPAVIQHMAAICQSRQHRAEIDVQQKCPSYYQVTIRKGNRELLLEFAYRKHRWILADFHLTIDGKPKDLSGTITEILRLLSRHEIGTDDPSPVRSARQPRNIAIETKKNTVIRV